ncbi:unnamed protein product [Bemisia tabaci]|uniref:Uncharacterized protein n=1 Tax=Bemisia tabaci TaxID=7038 RepID=A0A9P0F9P6_BEMTA|nr:unnamed protein product [Bemisia tabaci]
MINTPIRTATGKRYRKSNGVASGTYFTQLIGSICNTILISWMIITLTGHEPEDLVVLGDDSLFPLSKKLDGESISQFFEKIGMEVNLEKSQIEKSLAGMKFLGYTLNRGMPMKSFDDWMTALVFPEYPDQSFSDTQSRALGLYYATRQKNLSLDKQRSNPTKECGVKCRQTDFSSEEMASAIHTFLRQLGVDEKRQSELEEATIGQSENDLWNSERRIRATASKYGEIFKRRN